jgi:hypothetical protein
MLRSLREFLQWRQGDSIILAEANVLPETDLEYFGKDGDRMHMMFNFQANQTLFYAMAAAKVAADVETAIRATLASGVGMLKTAKMHGVGCGTVQRISREQTGVGGRSEPDLDTNDTKSNERRHPHGTDGN